MPLTLQEQQEADDLELSKLMSEKEAALAPLAPLTSSDVHSRAQRTGSAFDSTRPNLKPGAGITGAGIDMALEAGIPMVGQALTAPGAGTGVTSAVGAGLSLVGNLLAQTRRRIMGEQDKFHIGEATAAGLVGAIPFAGPEANAARAASRGMLKSALNVGATAVKMGYAGLTGEAVKTLIDEGRAPTPAEAGMAAAVPGILGGGASTLGNAAEGAVSAGTRLRQKLSEFEGVAKPTPGMLLPTALARAEQQTARRNPDGSVAAGIDEAYSGLKGYVQGMAPNPAEKAAIFEQADPLVGQITRASDELQKLDGSAKTATFIADSAAQKLNQAVAAGDQAAAQQYQKTATQFSDQALNANFASAVQNAKDIAAARITGGAEGMDAATARTAFVDHVAKPVRAAIDAKTEQMFAGIDKSTPLFTTEPILQTAEDVAMDITGKLPKKLDSAIKMIREELIVRDADGNPQNLASLQQLRNARDDLLRRVKLGESGSSTEEHLIKKVAASITEQINQQATHALGPVDGQRLLDANKFYSETRALLDQPGVDVLFNKGAPDTAIHTMLGNMRQKGVNADEYRNVQNLLDKIGETNPELKTAAQAHVQDVLRRAVIFDSSAVRPSMTEGGLMVDPNELVKRLDNLGQVPGTLEALNLGNRGKVAELKRLVQGYPEAAKMSAAQWGEIMQSPAFSDATSHGELSVALQPILAQSQAEAQLVKSANLRAGGQVDAAKKAYDAAMETVGKAGGDVAAARSRYESLLNDPVAVAMNNPRFDAGGANAFFDTLFNSAASRATNQDIAAVVGALDGSLLPSNKRLLAQLRERYIADKIAAYHSAPAESSELSRTAATPIANFFDPVHAGDAMNDIRRAQTILTQPQMDALGNFARTARAIADYEKAGGIPNPGGGYSPPMGGALRRGLDAVADLYRAGKYTIAAKLLADPAKLSRVAINAGNDATTAANALSGAAQNIGRAVDNQP